MGDEQTHPKRVIPAPGSKSGTSSAKRSAGTYHYPFEHRCSSRHLVGPGAARLRRLAGMTLSTDFRTGDRKPSSSRAEGEATQGPRFEAGVPAPGSLRRSAPLDDGKRESSPAGRGLTQHPFLERARRSM